MKGPGALIVWTPRRNNQRFLSVKGGALSRDHTTVWGSAKTYLQPFVIATVGCPWDFLAETKIMTRLPANWWTIESIVCSGKTSKLSRKWLCNTSLEMLWDVTERILAYGFAPVHQSQVTCMVASICLAYLLFFRSYFRISSGGSDQWFLCVMGDVHAGPNLAFVQSCTQIGTNTTSCPVWTVWTGLQLTSAAQRPINTRIQWTSVIPQMRRTFLYPKMTSKVGVHLMCGCNLHTGKYGYCRAFQWQFVCSIRDEFQFLAAVIRSWKLTASEILLPWRCGARKVWLLGLSPLDPRQTIPLQGDHHSVTHSNGSREALGPHLAPPRFLQNHAVFRQF